MACTTNFLDTAFEGNIRLLGALAVSLSLHLAAFALLVAFIPANDVSSGRLTALPKAQLTVTIAGPESRLVAQTSAQSPLNPDANKAAVQSVRKDDAPSSSKILQHERYYPTSELDMIPRVQHDIDLYPAELHGFKHGGKVVLGLWIDENGHVTKAETISSELPAIFAEVAAQGFLRANFFPGMKQDQAVKSRVRVVLSYPSQPMGK